MQLSIYNSNTGKQEKQMEVAEQVFGVKYNDSLVHQVVVAYMNNSRLATKGHKNRAAVRGGGRKPYKQKGTGRARAGTTRSPIRVGGGKTFVANANHQQKINKKMYRMAMKSILSELIRTERLKVVSLFEIKEAKTKFFVEKMKVLNLDDMLVIMHEYDENAILASSNLYHGDVCEVSYLDPVSLIGFGSVVATEESVRKIEEWLSAN